jgi:hypothetical protein
MPRIELITEHWLKYGKPRGNGSPTEDVCEGCALDYQEGDDDAEFPGHKDLVEIGSTDVDHPPYDAERMYRCAICDAVLTEEDD